MWDGLFMLLTLSTVMGIASFLAGSLPLSFALSQRQLRLISAVGTGVLVGTSLIVIIPEGIETLYSASPTGHAHGEVKIADGAPLRGGTGALKLHTLDHTVQRRKEYGDIPASISTGSDPTDPAGWSHRPRDDAQSAPLPNANHQSHDEEESNPHAWVGLSLILGFTLMYLIDTLPHLSSASTSTPRPLHISLSNLSQGLHDASTSPSPSPPSSPSHSFPTDYPPSPHHYHHPQHHHHNPPSTTIGLTLHALADGIALGASTASPAARASLGLLVFLALMIHKAPAAFGLTAVLLKQGRSKRAARAHLVVFSLAAPVGAVVTWGLVKVLGGGGGGGAGEAGKGGVGGGGGMGAEGRASVWWTGIVLIFSGGTFLYVAMHSMQSSSSSHTHHPPDAEANGSVYGDGYPTPPSKSEQGPTAVETAATVVGMLLPLLTQVGHARAHGH